MSGERGGHGVGPSLPLNRFGTLYPRTDEQVTPTVAVHRPVGELPMAEVQHVAPSCQDKRLLKWCTKKEWFINFFVH
jgi:hypothetical protein